MKNTSQQNTQELISRIRCPERAAARRRDTVKLRFLLDYVRQLLETDPYHRDVAARITRPQPPHPGGQPRPIRIDDDGDIVITQPDAERFILSAADTFGGALALILMTETCYGPSIAEPGQFNAALAQARGLVLECSMPCAFQLYDFLEFDGDPLEWIPRAVSNDIGGPDLGVHILSSMESDPTDPEVDLEIDMIIYLSPERAAKVAAATPTLRGRKIKACLEDPGITSADFAENDPALLELLCTPPTRGHLPV